MGRLRAVTCCRTSSAPWRERHLDISLRAQPSVRHQDKRRRLTSADICAIREAELILRQDIKPAVQSSSPRRSRFMQLPTSAPTGHHAAPDIREGLRLPRERVLVHAAAPWRQSHGREGAGSGACRTWKSCRHGRGRHQVTLPCRFMQHAPCFSSIERDIRQRAGHGAAVCLCLTRRTVPHSPLCLTEALRHYPTEAQE